MFPEVLIAVTKNHWHCITCKVYNKRVVSIDQHLRVKHPDVSCSETSEHPFAQFENVEHHIVHGYKKHSHFNDKHGKLECKITTKCKKETCNTFNTERKSETPPEQHSTIATDASNDKQSKEFSCAIGQRTRRKRKLIKDEWINKKRMIDNGINKNLLQSRLRTRKHKISHIQSFPASFENRLKQVNSLTSSVSGKNNKLSFVYHLEEKLLKQSNSGELLLSNSLQENSTFSSDDSIPHSLNKNNTKQQNKMLRIHRIKQKANHLDSKIMTTSKKLTNNKSDSVFQNPDHGALQCSNSKAVKKRELTQRLMRSIKVSYVGTQEQRTVNSQTLASSIPQAHELWEDRQGDTGESDSGMNSVSCDAFSRQQSFIAETSHSVSFPSFTRLDLDSKDTFFNQTISIVVNQNLEYDLPIASNADLQNSNLDTSSSCVKQLPSAQKLVNIDHKGAKLDHGNEITGCDRQHHNATSAVLRTNDFPVNADSNNTLGLESDRHSNLSQKQVTPSRRDSCSISDKEATTASTDESWVKTVNFCFNNVVNKQSAIALSENVPSEIYKCRVCFAKFTTSECLLRHETAMAKFSVVHCKKCGQNFHGIHELNLHIFGEHEPYKRGFCFECDMASPSMERLELHVYSHVYSVDRKLTEMRYHDCRICMKEIKGEFVAMKNHYYTKHKAALCFECFTNSELVYFVDVSACREHRQSHAKHCIICKQEFSTAEEAQAHYLTHRGQVEEDGRGISCEKCGHWCPNRAMIVLHRREHKLQLMRDRRAKQARTGFACLQCDKVLRSKRNLERHVTQVHSNIRTYKFHCEFCGKGVDYKSVLQDHIALHHLGIKRYACEFCNQRFACAPTLRRHILKEHATDKQYQCEFCDERFCEKVKLDRHLTSHTGLSRFMCEQCGKGFHTRSEFCNHMKVHALRKEFICSECGQEFKRKEHLTRHMHKNCQNLTQT